MWLTGKLHLRALAFTYKNYREINQRSKLGVNCAIKDLNVPLQSECCCFAGSKDRALLRAEGELLSKTAFSNVMNSRGA